MEIPRDIAIPMADELLAENPDIPLAALIHKATAYLAQDAPKRPGISRVKRTEWGAYPRRICADVMPMGLKARPMTDSSRLA